MYLFRRFFPKNVTLRFTVFLFTPIREAYKRINLLDLISGFFDMSHSCRLFCLTAFGYFSNLSQFFYFGFNPWSRNVLLNYKFKNSLHRNSILHKLFI